MKPLASALRYDGGPNVAVWVSNECLDIWKVTTVPALTVSVDGNIVKSSTPPGPDSPRLTVSAGGLALATLAAALTSAVTWATVAAASCLAVGIVAPAGLTTTVPIMPGCTSQKYL